MPGQMGLRREREKVLTPAGIRPGQRHSHSTARIWQQCKLVTNCVTRSAFSVAARIAILRHEAGHYAMERKIVVETPVGERREIEYRKRRLHSVECDNDATARGAHRCRRRMPAQRRKHYTAHGILIPLERTLDCHGVERPCARAG